MENCALAETSQALSWLSLAATVWGKTCHPSVCRTALAEPSRAAGTRYP